MSKFEIEGTIKHIGEVQSFASGFTKRTFVVTEPHEKYPQDIAFELVKDGCAKLDAYSVGDGVKVSFNIRGNEYNGKYYVQLSAWKIDSAPDHGVGARSEEYGKAETRSGSQNGAPPPRDNGGGSANDPEDDIPFGPMAVIPGF